jgi:hypothetical protein
MFWQIGGAVDTTGPARASAGRAPGRARAAHLGLCPACNPARRVAHPHRGAGPQPAEPKGHRGEGIALVTAARPRRKFPVDLDPAGHCKQERAIVALTCDYGPMAHQAIRKTFAMPGAGPDRAGMQINTAQP